MMRRWPAAVLGDHVELKTGFPFKSQNYTKAGGVRLLRGDNIAPGGIRWDGAKRWPDADVDAYRQYELAVRDVVLAMDRPWIDAGLKTAVVAPTDVPALLVQRVARLRSGPTLDQRFLRYLLASPSFERHILAVQTGTAVPHVSSSQIAAFSFALPSLAEQETIGSLLGALDDKIELNRRMNETLEALVSALFGSHFASSPLAMTLGGLVELSRASLDPQQFPHELFDHYSIPAFDNGRGPVVEAGAEIKSTKLIVLPGSVLLSKLNPRFPRLWLPGLHTRRRAISSTEFLVCRPRESVDRTFLYGLFSSRRFQDEFATLVTGTSGSHQRVKPADFLALRVSGPSKEEIDAYSSVARPLLDRVLHNVRESETLAQLRDTLLPKLVSGEVRLRDALSDDPEPATKASLASRPAN